MKNKILILLIFCSTIATAQVGLLSNGKGEAGQDGTDGATVTAIAVTGTTQKITTVTTTAGDIISAPYADLVLTDAQIGAMGYIKTDTNTQLSESEVDAFVANNGYLTAETQNLADVINVSNSAGNNKISDLADPTTAQDAATKAYVDSATTYPHYASIAAAQAASETGFFTVPTIVEGVSVKMLIKL